MFRGAEGGAATHLYVKLYGSLQAKGFGGNYVAKAEHVLGMSFVLIALS